MKKLLMVLAMIVSSTFAFAENESNNNPNPELPIQPAPEERFVPQGWFKAPIMVDCGPKKLVIDQLKGDYAETPLATGTIMVMWPNGAVMPGSMLIVSNPATKSWSMIAGLQDDIWCIVGHGAGLTPAQPSEKISIKY